MSWIKVIEYEDANNQLKSVYDRIKTRTDNTVANILKVHSLNPTSLVAHLNLYETLMFGNSNLTRAQREMIGVIVSSSNACEYWTSHHGEALRYATNNHRVMYDISTNYQNAEISNSEKTMLKYAIKLTKQPYTILPDDIQQLKDAGFADRDILDINQITAYFNYVNRIADGLGVSLE